LSRAVIEVHTPDASMIENENLRTASLYINNQLLSRGLLRDGQNIDFADPDGGEGLPDTMGKIMGVVNDLILRRDVCLLACRPSVPPSLFFSWRGSLAMGRFHRHASVSPCKQQLI
jgi:hypothetical protein